MAHGWIAGPVVQFVGVVPPVVELGETVGPEDEFPVGIHHAAGFAVEHQKIAPCDLFPGKEGKQGFPVHGFAPGQSGGGQEGGRDIDQGNKPSALGMPSGQRTRKGTRLRESYCAPYLKKAQLLPR